ncbi:MAG: SNF2 helicase associated domain-containing protein [Clostridium sp.]
MDLNKIIKNFNIINQGNKNIRGRKIQSKGHISTMYFAEDENTGEVKITSNVLSDYDNKKIYNNQIILDGIDGSILYTECECEDYNKNSYYRENYMCKHIVATMLEFINREQFIEKTNPKNPFKELVNTITDKESGGKLVNLVPSIYKGPSMREEYFTVDFKIGTDRMYSLKNVMDFITATRNKDKITYGKEFTYNPKVDKFSKEDFEVVEFLDEFASIYEFYGGYTYQKPIKGKEVNIPVGVISRFLKLYKNRDISFNGTQMRVIEGIPLNLSVLEKDNKFEVNYEGHMPVKIARKTNVYFYENNLYIMNNDDGEIVDKTLSLFNESTKLEIMKEDEKVFFNNVLPRFRKISNNIKIDEKLDKLIKEYPMEAKFYIDIKKNNVVIDVEFIYGDNKISQFNEEDEGIIIRDYKKESEIKILLKKLKLYEDNKEFIFMGNEEELYNFFTAEYKELEVLGEVFYSDAFKEKSKSTTPKIKSNIKKTENDYFEISFNIEDVNEDEYKGILKSIKENKKFYRLKDGSFLSLNDEKTKEFFNMIDDIGKNEKNISKFFMSSNKAFLLESYLDKNELSFVKGKDEVKNITNRLNNLESLELDIPKELKATLREYQVVGYKWFKTLSYLGFGGILADEMGLGKTVQSIGFLLSEREGTHLIVAPTSLIYNWKNEFKKFAPSLNVGVIHGGKRERKVILKNINKYDIILTTYGTLRNDIDDYNNIEFNICLIDEGQNIKNSFAQNTKVIKSIKSRVRFALTGTPIENNILELWSIFDFVMPNFLGNINKFKSKFISGKDSMETLQKYIKPFILRRLKSEVLLELPDKIEKKYYIELNKEQKKVYQSYVANIKSIMEDQNFEGDKITILSYLTKLRQLCLHPELIIENYKGGSGKIEVLLEVVKERIEKGEKILLFSQFTSMLSIISKMLDKNEMQYFYIDGKVTAKRRMELVNEFNNYEGGAIFLISLKSGGTGLNLTSASTVIHFDPWWNPAVEEQASDRAHRIGQKNVVEVLKFIAEGTIEDKIINLQEEKKELINEVLSGGYDGGNVITSLSKNEILELL